MKRILIYLAAVAVAWTAFAACSNEFELNETYKNIPIVYGILSLQDTAQYIRVERAFIDTKTSALVLAKRADSLYYSTAVVQLQNTASGQTFTLQKVDGNKEGYVRDTGIFATNPNYLYKIKNSQLALQGGIKYKLTVKNASGDAKNIAESTAEVVDTVRVTFPFPGNAVRWTYDNTLSFAWSFNNQNTRVFDLKAVLHYDEYEASNPAVLTSKTLEWNIAQNIKPLENSATSVFYRIQGIDWYKFIGKSIPVSLTKKRIFRNFDVVVEGGGEALREYINAGQVNGGLTGSELPPTYTNINGGYGIFSSRTKNTQKAYPVDSATRDSIANGQYTRQLNFQ